MADGSLVSWEEMFDDFGPALNSYARSRGVREPEDLVQDVFVSVVEQQDNFEGDRAGLRSLLFTIAFRRIADEHRRTYRRPETLVAGHPTTPHPGPTVEEVVTFGESASEAMKAVGTLTDRERVVLQMRIVDEATPSQVASVLGLSSGNVRVIQARALVKVRECLKSVPEAGVSWSIPLVGAQVDFVRYLRSSLPIDDVLGPWIDHVKSAGFSSPEATDRGIPGASVLAVTPTDQATDTVSSFIANVAGPATAKIGALISIVAISAVAVPAIDGAPEVPPLSNVTETSVVETAQEHLDLAGVFQTLSPAADASDHTPSITIPGAIGALPTTPGEIRGQDPAEASLVPSLVESAVDAPAAANPTSNPVEGLVDPLLDDLVVPLVDGTVDLVVTDVIEPLVDDLVVPLVEDVVELVVVDTVGTVVDDVVEPLLDETVPSAVDDVGDILDETVSNLDSLLNLLR